MTDPASIEPPLAWRPTWPFGPADDFVADLPGGGWTRLEQVADPSGRCRWHWAVGGRGPVATGWAEARDAAEAALRRRLGTDAPRA